MAHLRGETDQIWRYLTPDGQEIEVAKNPYGGIPPITGAMPPPVEGTQYVQPEPVAPMPDPVAPEASYDWTAPPEPEYEMEGTDLRPPVEQGEPIFEHDPVAPPAADEAMVSIIIADA